MATFFGIIGILCLGKAFFMGWLHKKEWRLLRITDPSRWWKLQIKQALWGIVGFIILLVVAQTPEIKNKKKGDIKKSAPIEQTTDKSESNNKKTHSFKQDEPTSSKVKEETYEDSPSAESTNESEESNVVSNESSNSSNEEEKIEATDDKI